MLDKCPHCGYGEYYVRCRMSGFGDYSYQYDGSVGDNTAMHDCLTYTENKTMYCGQCHKKVGIKK